MGLCQRLCSVQLLHFRGWVMSSATDRASHTGAVAANIRTALETGNAGPCAEKKRGSRSRHSAFLLHETVDQIMLACQISAVRPCFSATRLTHSRCSNRHWPGTTG